ncbi:hypothetical protein QBC34DRAFT_422948 [Podospora aff. communis PSN243]|uniref:Uncharacterized protein n=1 Tax=Podospora aff. communis PSN243 TaxID=3040156 RepID=A0AAV9GYK0_9PEZI|nr:hypothetical protein QBC34DRAFT_422948 [Podospora aff. communis PSN243]
MDSVTPSARLQSLIDSIRIIFVLLSTIYERLRAIDVTTGTYTEIGRDTGLGLGQGSRVCSGSQTNRLRAAEQLLCPFVMLCPEHAKPREHSRQALQMQVAKGDVAVAMASGSSSADTPSHDEAERLMAYTYHDLCDFVINTRKTRNGSLTKKMRKSLATCPVTTNLQSATQQEIVY